MISRAAVAFGESNAEAVTWGKVERAIAQQLRRRGLFQPACEVVIELPALNARLVELEKQHADSLAAEELERRRQAEQVEVARLAGAENAEALADAARLRNESPEDRRRRDLCVEGFIRQTGFMYPHGGKMLSAAACAARLRGGADIGEFYRLLHSDKGVWHKQVATK
jgi:hypothetical protein